MPAKVEIRELPNRGDQRGFSYTLPAEALTFLERVQDVHLASVLPGAIRGNHFHLRRREVILVSYSDKWSFHWDEGPESSALHRTFGGSGTVMIQVSPGASHAVRNDGHQPFILVAASSESYDPTETVARKVV